jgi:hypothetical protein
MAETVVGPEDKTRLKGTFDAAISQLQEMDDIRESLKDLIQTVATELNVKPAELMTAIKIQYKNKLDETNEKNDTVSSLVAIYRS